MSFDDLAQNVFNIGNRVLGTSVTYSHSGGGTVTINGVFDNAFVEVNNVSTLAPTLRINLSDLESEPVEGDTVTINAVTYNVVQPQPDGFGGALLILHKD